MALSSFVLSHVSGCGWVVPAFGIELATNKIQFLGVRWNIVIKHYHKHYLGPIYI